MSDSGQKEQSLISANRPRNSFTLFCDRPNILHYGSCLSICPFHAGIWFKNKEA